MLQNSHYFLKRRQKKTIYFIFLSWSKLTVLNNDHTEESLLSRNLVAFWFTYCWFSPIFFSARGINHESKSILHSKSWLEWYNWQKERKQQSVVDAFLHLSVLIEKVGGLSSLLWSIYEKGITSHSTVSGSVNLTKAKLRWKVCT